MHNAHKIGSYRENIPTMNIKLCAKTVETQMIRNISCCNAQTQAKR